MNPLYLHRKLDHFNKHATAKKINKKKPERSTGLRDQCLLVLANNFKNPLLEKLMMLIISMNKMKNALGF